MCTWIVKLLTAYNLIGINYWLYLIKKNVWCMWLHKYQRIDRHIDRLHMWVKHLMMEKYCHVPLWSKPQGQPKGTLISALCGPLMLWWGRVRLMGGLISYLWRRPQKQIGSNRNSKLFSEGLSAITGLDVFI